MSFTANVQASEGLSQHWTTSTADERTITCSIPKEFGGPNSGHSPEDLYLAALMNCYVATLKVIAANSKMSFDALAGHAVLTLDRDETTSTPWMANVKLMFTAQGVENVDRFRRLMERVSKQCMIINSVRSVVTFEFEVLAK